MKALIFTSILISGAALLLAADVKTDYAHSADWGRYHTYSWIGVQAGNSLWQDRIKRDVDMVLGERGWSQVPSGGDASVSAFGSTAERPTIDTFYDGLGGGWFWHGFGDGMATTTVENQPIGTLTVDIFDSGTKKLIWRGTATKALSDHPEANEKKLEDQVTDMFRHFPPNSRG